MTDVEINSDGYNDWDVFDISIDHIDGTTHAERINVKDGSVRLQLGKLCSGFKFRPERKILSDPTIKSVIVTGLTLAEFHEYEWAIKEYGGNLAALTDREQKYDALKDEVKLLREEKSQLDSEVGKSRAQNEQLKAESSSASISIEKQKSELSDIGSEIESARNERRKIRTEISDNETKLDELVRQVRLFPSEIVGFVKEGNRNIRAYLLIGVPFVSILAIVVYSLFSSAIDLTQLWRKEEGVDIWTIFLTRLPFVVVAVTVIEACGYIVGRLIFEIVRINRQRLEFAKLSIIAKDVTAASASGADVGEDDAFEYETKLKMELLREHMKSYTGSEFEYKGSAVISALVGVAERMSKKLGPS